MIDALLPEHIGSETAEELTGHFQAGVYAQAYRILDGASQFGYLFAGLLLPIFARMIKKKENIGPMVQLSFSLIIVPAIVIAITSSVFSSELMNTLYHGGTNYSAPIFAVIILGFISISTTYIFGTLLTANGSLKHLNIMAGIGITANLIINLSLIPSFMALGAAYSSLITQSITAIAQVIIAWKISNLKLNYFFISKVIVLILVTYFSAIFFRDLIENFWYAIISSISISILTSLIIKLLNIKDLFLIIKDSQMD